MKRTYLSKKSKSERNKLISSLLRNMTNGYKKDIQIILNYVIDNSNVFDIEELKGSLYEGEDETIELILPSIIRVFSKVFIQPPTLFTSTYDKDRLKLFQLYFDIDEFLGYLVNMLISSKGSLKSFDNLDRTSETLSLIVDNYVAGIIKKILESYDIKGEIIKLKRDKKIKSITNDQLGN